MGVEGQYKFNSNIRCIYNKLYKIYYDADIQQ